MSINREKIRKLANKKTNNKTNIKQTIETDFHTTTKNKMENYKIYEDSNGNKEIFKQSKVHKIHDELDKIGWRRINPVLFLNVLIQANFNLKNLKVLKYMLENMNNKNEISITQAQILEDLEDVGKNSIVDTFKNLKKEEALKKYRNLYIFNPFVVSSRANTEEILHKHGFYLLKENKEEKKIKEDIEYYKQKLAKLEEKLKATATKSDDESSNKELSNKELSDEELEALMEM